MIGRRTENTKTFLQQHPDICTDIEAKVREKYRLVKADDTANNENVISKPDEDSIEKMMAVADDEMAVYIPLII